MKIAGQSCAHLESFTWCSAQEKVTATRIQIMAKGSKMKSWQCMYVNKTINFLSLSFK